MEGIIGGIGGFIAFLVVLYFVGSLLERLPPKFERKHGAFGAPRFGAWVTVNSYNVEDYRVGYVNEWEIGYTLSAYCEGTVELGTSETKSSEKRVTIKFYAFRDAYQRSNVIGWAEDKGDYANVHLTLAPAEVRDVLHELRREGEVSMHVHGWADEKNIKIEYFRLGTAGAT